MSERQAKYRARLAELGLVQVAVWIPTDKKDELRRLVRELCAGAVTGEAGPSVSSDSVSSDASPQPKPVTSDSVFSDAGPKVTSDRRNPKDNINAYRKAKADKARHQKDARQAQLAAEFAATAEKVSVRHGKKDYEAAVIRREIRQAQERGIPPLTLRKLDAHTLVELLVQRGKQFQKVAIFVFADRQVSTPLGYFIGSWAEMRKAEEQRLRRVARDNHPDRNPNGNVELYQQAIEALDHLRGAHA